MSINTKGVISGNYFEVGPDGYKVSITSGSGIPSTNSKDGSLYLRQDGTSSSTIYSRQGSSWSVISGGSSGTDIFNVAGFTGDGQLINNTENLPPDQGALFSTTHKLGGHLAAIPPNCQNIIDGTYGTGSEKYRSGVWVSHAGGVSRIQLNNKKITRIPLDVLAFPSFARSLAFDYPTNRLFYLDINISNVSCILWVIDSTPTINQDSDHITNVAGVLNKFDLTSTIIASTGGSVPSCIVFDGTDIWLGGGNCGNFLFKVNINTGFVTTYSISVNPTDILFTKQFNAIPASIWITDSATTNVYRANPSTGSITDTIAISTVPVAGMNSTLVFPTPNFPFVFVGANFDSGLGSFPINIIDPQTFTLVTAVSSGGYFPNAILPINDGVSVALNGSNVSVAHLHSNTGGSSWDNSGATITSAVSFGSPGGTFNLFIPNTNFSVALLPSQLSVSIGGASSPNVYSAGNFIFAIDSSGMLLAAPDDGTTAINPFVFIEGVKSWESAPGNPVVNNSGNDIYYPPGTPNAPINQIGLLVNDFTQLFYDYGSETLISAENSSKYSQTNPPTFASLLVTSDGRNTTISDVSGSIPTFTGTEPNITATVNRNDRFIKSINGTGGAGSYFTQTVYTIPSMNPSRDAYAIMATIKIVGAGIDGYNSVASWEFKMDVANIASPTSIFSYNPNTLPDPTFAWSGTSLSVTFPPSSIYLYWTVIGEITYLQTING